MRRYLVTLIVAGVAAPLMAAPPTVNGNSSGDSYGAAYAVQTVETGFGDANPNFGSELDAAYARVDSGRLYLMLTGNIEANFNKLEIFFEAHGGGYNTFPALPGNDGAGNMASPGLTFKNGFAPNYHMIVRRGTADNVDRFDVDYAVLGTNTYSSYNYALGFGNLAGTGSTGTGPANSSPIQLGYDNSNVLGVGGNAPLAANQAAAAAVTTGFEVSIALADLGSPTDQICIMVAQNNQGHNYFSNQFLPGLAAPQGNLGGDGTGGFIGGVNIDLNNFGGDGDFCVAVPEPTSLALFALAGLVGLRRRA